MAPLSDPGAGPEAAGLRRIEDLGLGGLEAVRHILTGASIIDWRRLNFTSRAAVQEFLTVNGFHWDDPRDRLRLDAIAADARDYLATQFGFRFPKALREEHDVRDLILMASAAEPAQKRVQALACATLKVMDIIQHLDARKLSFRVTVSDLALAAVAEAKIHNAVRQIAQHGVDVQLTGGQKTRDSLITKLLVKKEATAAQIFDRLRFRLVVESRDDIIPVLDFMTRNLFPFNFVVPGASRNSLVPLRAILDERGLSKWANRFQWPFDRADEAPASAGQNEYSGPSYRILNFVADLPLRLDELQVEVHPDIVHRLGCVIYETVELQIVDSHQAQLNEEGENSHELYKRRQRERALERLDWDEIAPLVATPVE